MSRFPVDGAPNVSDWCIYSRIEFTFFLQFDPKRRGNSIFAELEDRRLEVEKILVSMKVKLKYSEASNKQLREQLSRSLLSLQCMASQSNEANLRLVNLSPHNQVISENELAKQQVPTLAIYTPIYSDSFHICSHRVFY